MSIASNLGIINDVKTEIKKVGCIETNHLADYPNLLAKGLTDTPETYTFSEQTTANGGSIKDTIAFVDKIYGNCVRQGETILTNNSNSICSKSRNIWDEQWELGQLNSNTGANQDNANRMRSKNYIEIDSTKSYIWGASVSNGVCLYDASKTFISTKFVASNGIINQLPSNAKYMRFWCPFTSGTTYANDICIEEGTTSHGYVPYFSNILNFGHNEIFPNGLLGVGDVRDSIDLANGIATKKIGVVDLGSLTWTAAHNATRFYSSGISSLIAKYSTSSAYNVLCSKFDLKENYTTAKSMYFSSAGNISINDTGYETLTADEFKTAMNGVLLYYESATPTETTIAKAKAYYKVSANGKEIAVSEGLSAPMVADIAYRGMSAEDLINELNG